MKIILDEKHMYYLTKCIEVLEDIQNKDETRYCKHTGICVNLKSYSYNLPYKFITSIITLWDEHSGNLLYPVRKAGTFFSDDKHIQAKLEYQKKVKLIMKIFMILILIMVNLD